MCKGMNFPLRLGLSCSLLPLTATKLAMLLGESNIRLGVGLDFLLQHQARFPHLTQPKILKNKFFYGLLLQNWLHQYPVRIQASNGWTGAGCASSFQVFSCSDRVTEGGPPVDPLQCQKCLTQKLFIGESVHWDYVCFRKFGLSPYHGHFWEVDICIIYIYIYISRNLHFINTAMIYTRHTLDGWNPPKPPKAEFSPMYKDRLPSSIACMFYSIHVSRHRQELWGTNINS